MVSPGTPAHRALHRRAKAQGIALRQSRFTECLHHRAACQRALRACKLRGLRPQGHVNPCYPSGCGGARQACRLASSPNVANSNNAWNVNFNNGNVNNNNRSNNNYVRLVRASQWKMIMGLACIR